MKLDHKECRIKAIRETLIVMKNRRCSDCRKGKKFNWNHNVRWHGEYLGRGSVCLASFEHNLLELDDDVLLKRISDPYYENKIEVKNKKESLNEAIETLKYYADETYYNPTYIDADGRGMHAEAYLDRGKKARETLDEIRNRSIDLRGEETEESQDKEVEKVE